MLAIVIVTFSGDMGVLEATLYRNGAKKDNKLINKSGSVALKNVEINDEIVLHSASLQDGAMITINVPTQPATTFEYSGMLYEGAFKVGGHSCIKI